MGFEIGIESIIGTHYSILWPKVAIIEVHVLISSKTPRHSLIDDSFNYYGTNHSLAIFRGKDREPFWSDHCSKSLSRVNYDSIGIEKCGNGPPSLPPPFSFPSLKVLYFFEINCHASKTNYNWLNYSKYSIIDNVNCTNNYVSSSGTMRKSRALPWYH